jgi:hypothetical protein
MVGSLEIKAKGTTQEAADSLHNLASGSASRDSLALLRDSMNYGKASAAAKEFWHNIEEAQKERPDLLQTLVGACVQRGIDLPALDSMASGSDGLTMWSVINGNTQHQAANLSLGA